eukprot:1000285_1
MEELIEFTLLLEQLDEDELVQYLAVSMKHYGHSLFRKLFFHYFMNHRTDIKEHTQYVSDIINARKDKPNLCTKGPYIDQLPSTLIAECASYLQLNEYVLFAQSNRQIFVSTNKPFKLYQLTESALRKCPQSMSMRKFRAVKSIHICIQNFHQRLSIPNQSVWKDSSFDKVILSNNCSQDEEQTALFLNKKAINLNKVTALSLCDFGDDGDVPYGRAYSCEAFCKILRCLKNVKQLSLEDIYLRTFTREANTWKHFIQSELFNKDLIQNWLPNVTSFSVDTFCPVATELSKTIINSLGHQMESLHIKWCDLPPDHTVTSNWCQLKELELFGPSQSCLDVFSKVTTLQSMSVQSMDENVLNSCVDFMLKKQKSLHRMRIDLRRSP